MSAWAPSGGFRSVLINIQPSELMKIFLVLALARYYHASAIEDIGTHLPSVRAVAC